MLAKRTSFNLRVTEKTWRLVNKESCKTQTPMTLIFERIVQDYYKTKKTSALKKTATAKKKTATAKKTPTKTKARTK